MLKKLKKKLEKNKDKKVFETSQETLPYQRAYPCGIFKISKNRYSKVYKFKDINFQIATLENQKNMFLDYCEILNSLDDRAEYQISTINSRINLDELKEKIFIDKKEDELDKYRDEYNSMLESKVQLGSNDIESFKYITVTVVATDYNRAKKVIARNESSLRQGFINLGSELKELPLKERVKLYQTIYKDEAMEELNIEETKKQGLITKDLIAPTSFEFKRDKGMVGNQHFQTTFLTDLPAFLKVDILTELAELNAKMILTMNISSLSPDEAVSTINKQITGMRSDTMNLEEQSLKKGQLTTFIPHDLEKGLENAEELLEEVSSKNQKIFTINLLVTHFAESEEKLEAQLEELDTIARRHICRLKVLNFQQEDALASSIPLGNNRLKVERVLTTESTAVFMPFTSQELNDTTGMYYGINPITNNMILLNRKKLRNSSGFILGVSGSGKSFASKREMLNVLLNTDDDVIIIDPEREYGELVKNLNGEVVDISASSPNIINPMDLTFDDEDDENPFMFKTDFILSMVDIMLGGNMDASTKSIVDRCIRLTYKDFISSGYDRAFLPTLKDFYNVVVKQEEVEAKDLATVLEMYVLGNLEMFSGHSNIDIDNRFVCFDIVDLGTQLKTLGLLVVLDAVWNRIRRNQSKGKHTWIYFDEAHLLFQNDYARDFLFTLYRRARKYGGIPTGMTQNISDMLVSEQAETMLANSEYVMFLGQAETDIIALDKIYELSDTQLDKIRNVSPGNGLIKYGGTMIPFKDEFPQELELYDLMTTKLEEVHERRTRAELEKGKKEVKAIKIVGE